jgi:ribonucleoside-diphosphate reductase alpha chain
MIAEAAWNSAEPGVVFMERYNKWHNNWYFNKINCVNPCGEEGLPPYGVCNLGSINLVPFVNKDGSFDFKSLEEHVGVAVRFLDNVVNSDIYIFEGIRETQLNGERRVGLGTMGLGDALIKMKIRYGSPKSLKIIEKIYKLMSETAYSASSDLAKEKGPFPKFDSKKYLDGYFIKKFPEVLRDKIRKQGVRNSIILMQAPTGSTSLLSGVTSGIEPVFEFSLIRRDRLGEHTMYHPLYEEWKNSHPDEDKPDYFVSAQELTPEDHIKVQAMIQKYVDASISKTVNAPETFTVEDVKKLYNMAYELGCKGVTFMRSGSRPGVLETLDNEKTKEAKSQETNGKSEASVEPLFLNGNGNGHAHLANGNPLAERPFMVTGSTYRLETPVGKAFITINETETGQPLEVFINLGKAGSDVAAMAEALGRTISTSLRFMGHLSPKERAYEIALQLSGIGGRRSVGFGPSRIRSLPDAVSVAISKHFGFKINGNGHVAVNGESDKKAGAVMAAYGPAPRQSGVGDLFDPTPAPALKEETTQTATIFGDICPSCGASTLIHEEGCAKCYNCGHSEC